LFFFLFFTGCSGESAGDPVDDEARNLGNCLELDGFGVSETAPAFFRTYFRCVDVSESASEITLRTTNVPARSSNYFDEDHPNYEPFDYSRGDGYAPNRNGLSVQDVTVTISLAPQAKGIQITEALVDGEVGSSNEEYPMGPTGVAIDGLVLFNPLAAPGHDIEEEKYTFDNYNSHPTEDGTMHYHTETPGPLAVLVDLGLSASTALGSGEIELFGMMCDGTLVLGCTELDGSAPDASELDAQGGHLSDIVDVDGETHFENRYHTHICRTNSAFPHGFTPEIAYYSDCDVDN
jgi:hypothetical protein